MAIKLSEQISDELIRTSKQYKEKDLQTDGMVAAMQTCAKDIFELCTDVHDIEHYCQEQLQALIKIAVRNANVSTKTTEVYYNGIIDGYDLSGVIAMSMVDDYYQVLLKRND